jgi:hypothetical protein
MVAGTWGDTGAGGVECGSVGVAELAGSSRIGPGSAEVVKGRGWEVSGLSALSALPLVSVLGVSSSGVSDHVGIRKALAR